LHFTKIHYFFDLLDGGVNFFVSRVWGDWVVKEEIVGRHNIIGVGALFEG
jgi:hypothetical protein